MRSIAETEPSDESFDVVFGTVGEWMPEWKNGEPFVIRGLVNIGRIENRWKNGGHDFFRFLPVPDDGFHPPRSYGGTSGGGLRRVYPRPKDGDPMAFPLIGVAFYETEEGQIVCHGQASIYCRLYDAIREKWGAEI